MLSEVDKSPKVFTLEAANRTLPLVSRVLRDIVDCSREVDSLRREIQSVEETDAREVLRGRIEGKFAEIEGYLAELRNIGCECKDPRVGLVDFPARLGGRVVLLCWKLGEDEVSHWHERSEGFAGRQPEQGSF